MVQIIKAYKHRMEWVTKSVSTTIFQNRYYEGTVFSGMEIISF